METKFIPINEKAVLIVSIQSGNKYAIDSIINELDRLESIIRNYEIGMRQVSEKFENAMYKEPAILNF